MKKTLHIKATIDEPGFLEDMVEKLACRHSAPVSTKHRMPKNQKALETSSTETYVSGTIIIEDSTQQIKMPFITSFLFTCTKEKVDIYNLEWGISLS